MLFEKPLTPIEIETLENLNNNHLRHVPPLCAHIILLSEQGYSISTIKTICKRAGLP
jgi:hypothetical protein